MTDDETQQLANALRTIERLQAALKRMSTEAFAYATADSANYHTRTGLKHLANQLIVLMNNICPDLDNNERLMVLDRMREWIEFSESLKP